ncbi:YbaB/EbfC family nucleoid-associated protein [Nonomuraea diastatica]|uniref:YbaB/EbfC family DNA-binding protein n=1 Tax=Nonomuraea diastatica TaxID=1848329 RepID=A0A4R4WP13_9ACTN|nr:YbaB/EbfC family nucleoid-associated protein [Nonomuraea diastatica]TDD18854.1 YbaB/EbfC family DNA-binding protein [Nonomuraea diastatica]
MRPPAPEDDAEFLARYVERSQEIIRGIRAAQVAIGQVESRAESRDGLVEAAADGHGRLTRLRIDPRALRQGERALGGQVAAVLRAAQEEAARQAQEIADEASERAGALPEPLDETFVRDRVEQAAHDLLS